ncbi:MAG: HDIG domain-containing metalloprotein, partial [Acidimicrobiia bacterium]
DLRRAVALSAIALGALAAPIAWLFYTGDEPLLAIGYAAGAAFLNGLIGGLVAVAALSFLEIIFDVTTTLRLLDLTDRNHPALQLLEEKARGTFNHSLTVGTLADGAARAIGAANLLARSAAYYHDLGKTENPTFYIENQFGGFNPHNQLLPEESAEIIRQHVIEGVRLAKEYRIPTDVAEGILTHHGDGIMRYFYHKALERYPEAQVDVEDYRHMGHKPQSKEMAILMLADSVEGACRAVFAEKDPSPEAIADVVERVTGEKVSDGQLSESSLTMGELTRVKESFIDSLIGNYHQRIPYPEFPRLEEGVAGAIGPGASVGGDTDDASDSSVRSADVE